jgi:predicted DNA-binding ribbon-helix-helix protein
MMDDTMTRPDVAAGNKRSRTEGPLGRKSAIVKRSIELHGHKTSVSLEDQFWDGLRDIAERTRTPLPMLLQTIDAQRGYANLSSAIRVYVLEHHRAVAAQADPHYVARAAQV